MGVISKRASKVTDGKERLTASVQRYMDAKARERGYDDIKTAVSYAGETAVAKFNTEGKAFRAWRSLVWAACYQIMDEVQAGTRAIPTEAELIAALPAISLPE